MNIILYLVSSGIMIGLLYLILVVIRAIPPIYEMNIFKR